VSSSGRGRGRRSAPSVPFPDLGPGGEPIPISTGTAELVVESDGSVLLMVNGVPSSHLDPDPDHLVFEYMRWMRTSLRCWAQEHRGGDDALQIGHLGGAGCALPRTLAHEWPRARQIVVELDALLAEQVRTWFSLPRSPQLRIRVDDAARALADWREGRFDVLTRDVFAGSSTPDSLTSLQAARHAHRVLAGDGLYLANCASAPGTHLLADELTTLGEVFAHVGAIAEPAHLKGRRRGNCVLLASDSPIPASLDRSVRSDPVAVRLAVGAEAARIAAPGRVLASGSED
jgi:spermidine synthase